jgi:myo-inositol-1(or 4)-monophosphatase
MSDISREELDGIYAFAVELGKKAGKMLMDAAQLRMSGTWGSKQEKEHVQKENAVDLVTETDEGKSKRICDRATEHVTRSMRAPC